MLRTATEGLGDERRRKSDGLEAQGTTMISNGTALVSKDRNAKAKVRYDTTSGDMQSTGEERMNKMTKDINTIITGDTSGDYVKVVRCRKCQHCRYIEDSDTYYCDRRYPRRETEPDGYCNYGEVEE